MARMTVAEAVVECLLAEDITHVFNLSGTQILPILDVVDRHPKMRLVLTRHEQGAGLMAVGYANATRRPALCMATVGPGAANLVSGVAAAYKSLTPLIAITGVHDRWLHQRDGHQELDHVGLYQPITKWSHMAPTGEKVPELLRRAFRIATTGLPGPVHLAIPRDVQMEEIDFKPMEPWQYRSQPRMDCDLSQMDQIVRLLSQARSPAILAGPEVSDEEATADLIAAAERLGIPVATSADSPDAIPSTHPLAIGSIGGAGSELANAIVKGADVLLAIGMHFDWPSTQSRYRFISEDTKIVHVTRFGQIVGTTFLATIAVEGSSRQFLRALAQEAQAGRLPRRTIDLASRKREWDEKRLSAVDGRSKPIKSDYVVRVIREALPENGILITDDGNFNTHFRRQFDYLQPNTFFHPREYGGIGVGLPYALGVKMARPNQEVILAAGDGGFMLNVGELETAVREKVKLAAVIFNDHGLGSERAHEKHEYGGRYFATEYGDVNFAKMAEAAGAYGIRVTEPSDLPNALRLAMKQDRLSVLDLLTDPEDLGTPSQYRKG